MCRNYGLEHDIRFNSKKSTINIFRNSFVKDFSFPSFVMNGESIKEVPFVKYRGHIISADMKDDLDIIYLFIYYVIFTQEYPISVQHCSPWGSCITYMTIQTSISIHSVLIQ